MIRRNSRPGFTLVELLVVISIIGMLMALLLPAVNAARESGRANTCRNNIRNLALAVISYESTTGAYPGFIDGVRKANNATQFWARPLAYMVMPQLERNDIHDAYNAASHARHMNEGSGGTALVIDFLQCPSNPQQTGNPTAFVYNCGYPGSFDSFNNGVFTYRYGGNMQRPGNSSANLTSHDGGTNTVMLSENIGSRNQSGSAGGWRSYNEAWIGFLWHDRRDTNATPPYNINGRKGQRGSSGSTAWARPASNHPQVVNAAFCDGHVRTINENIRYTVWTQLMTVWGRQAIASGSATATNAPSQNGVRNYTLNDSDIP